MSKAVPSKPCFILGNADAPNTLPFLCMLQKHISPASKYTWRVELSKSCITNLTHHSNIDMRKPGLGIMRICTTFHTATPRACDTMSSARALSWSPVLAQKLVDISCSHWIAIYPRKKFVLKRETKVSWAARSLFRLPKQTFLFVEGLFSTNLQTCAGIPTGSLGLEFKVVAIARYFSLKSWWFGLDSDYQYTSLP